MRQPLRSLKSPATPLILLVLAFITLFNLVIHTSITLAPYLYKALVASLKFTKALLQVAFASLENLGTESIYYFYPVNETNVLDTLTGALLSDLGRAVAAFGRLGGRICE